MKKLPFLIFLVFTAVYLTSCEGNAQGQAAYIGQPANAGTVNKVLDVSSFQKKLTSTSGIQLVDVRTPAEYQQGHIEGAVNIDFRNPSIFDQEFSRLNHEQPVMIYCRSGRRSAAAAKKLEAMGFREIYDLEGGYLQWSKE